MTNSVKSASVFYEHRGFESMIELNWTIPGLAGPDYLVITITRQGGWRHAMRLSSNYASVEEAIAAAENLIRHYTSVVSAGAK